VARLTARADGDVGGQVGHCARPLGQRHGAAGRPGGAPAVQGGDQRLRLARRVEPGRTGRRAQPSHRLAARDDDLGCGLLRRDAYRQRPLQLRPPRAAATRLRLVPRELLER
jgi:hypothetical protein